MSGNQKTCAVRWTTVRILKTIFLVVDWGQCELVCLAGENAIRSNNCHTTI